MRNVASVLEVGGKLCCGVFSFGGVGFRLLLLRGFGSTSASASSAATVGGSTMDGGDDEGVSGVAEAAVTGSISVNVEAIWRPGEEGCGGGSNADGGGRGGSRSGGSGDPWRVFRGFGCLCLDAFLGFRARFGFCS